MRTRKAFTMIEVLVVIGIIIVLLSILVPILAGARDSGVRLRCMSNMKQLLQANLLYQKDFDGHLPHPNWSNSTRGWLYDSQNPPPMQWVQSRVRTGLLWQYHQSEQTYRCPLDSGPWVPAYPSSNLTSYLMNGAVCGYGARPTGLPARWFKTDAICFWEPQEEGIAALGYPPWNDGSSQPLEGLTDRHGTKSGSGACVGLFGGSAEWLTLAEFKRLANLGTKNRAWCSPLSPNGR